MSQDQGLMESNFIVPSEANTPPEGPRPVGPFVMLVRDQDPDRTAEGLHVPEASKTVHYSGIVKGVGDDVPEGIGPGTWVKFSPAGQMYPVEGDLMVVHHKSIYAAK